MNLTNSGHPYLIVVAISLGFGEIGSLLLFLAFEWSNVHILFIAFFYINLLMFSLSISGLNIWDVLKHSVWQTALKLLAGDEEELLQIIPILIGCTREDIVEEKTIEPTMVRDVLGLMKETTFSHLMEVWKLFVRFAFVGINFIKQRTSRSSISSDQIQAC